MPLTDQYTGMMNRFCKSQFEYLCLQSPFQEIFNFESKYIIQFHARFVENTDTNETTNQGISFKETTSIAFCKSSTRSRKKQTFKGKKFTGCPTDLRECEL